MDYVAQVQSSNKKDAQSKAAWDFCENLVKTGFMKQSELPPKPVSNQITQIFFFLFDGYPSATKISGHHPKVLIQFKKILASHLTI